MSIFFNDLNRELFFSEKIEPEVKGSEFVTNFIGITSVMGELEVSLLHHPSKPLNQLNILQAITSVGCKKSSIHLEKSSKSCAFKASATKPVAHCKWNSIDPDDVIV